MLKDPRGLPLTLSDPAALAPLERAVRASLTYRGDPIAALDEALALAPDCVAAGAAKALIYMTFFERRFSEDALRALVAIEPFVARASERERLLVAAARSLAEGDWHGGTALLDQVLVEYPRDILALQVAHLMDFYRGDALNLRNRISRVLPHWSCGTPGYSFVLGMHAFGLEENNQYPEAESTGLRALAFAPEDAWAVHAVTHVFEMQGRIDEGVAFLREREGHWATEDNGFAFHNWWHLALFHLDRGDHDAALRIYDDVLGEAHGMALSRVDATSLLWRLRLDGVDVGARFDTVADAWEEAMRHEGGFYAFNDFHAAMAYAATGRTRAIAHLRAALEAAAWEKRANGEMTRAVGMDAAEAMIDFCEGDFDRATRRLVQVRDGAARFGGSHAQRDVLTLTLIESARRGGQLRMASHYAQERMMHKPAARWGWRILERIGTTRESLELAPAEVH
jgi:tetratricopeptide (TPR) repeat protein